MNRWTKGAEECWQQFCNDMRKQLDQTDVDPQEVLEDMRQHVEMELASQDLQVVTSDDLKAILSRLQPPHNTSETAAVTPPPAPRSEPSLKPVYQSVLTAFGGFYIVAFGVLLPLAAMIFELLTQVCASVFFDPLPTVWHIILFGMIPAFNLIGYLAVRSNSRISIGQFGFMNAMAIGIALFYTLWFLPVLPFSAIAVIAMGIGFCGLAPLLSLIAALMVRRRLRLLAAEQNRTRVPWMGFGLASGAGMMMIFMIPMAAAIIGLNMTASDQSAMQQRGLWLLRNVSSKQYLLKRCYDSRGMEPFGIDITGTNYLTAEQIRGIYYRVTGKSFNTERPKISFFHRQNNWIDEWDFDQAGDVVGGQLRDLSLISSQIDANLQGDGAVGYLEWVMVFQNDHRWRDREARCQIQLPPGGVVSRLTLWIDGQECEAAFGGRDQTKGAYKAVVQRQRDPVLVTTKGPDQVLLQCFPVQPNSGRMKVRVGISFPLDLISRQQALVQLPYLNERNFQIPETLHHQLWVEADTPLTAHLNLTNDSADGRYAIRGPVTNTQIEQQLVGIHLQRNPDVTAVWAQRDIAGETITVLQELHNNKDKSLVDKVVVVLDTSRAMASVIDEIQNVIETLQVDYDIEIVIADDIPQTVALADAGDVKKLFRQVHCSGGKDNMLALVRAWDVASLTERAAIVWIHAVQPHLFEESEGLTQRWMRRPEGPRLIHIQTAPGPNMVVEALDGVGQVQAFSRSASLSDDLKRLFGQLNGSVPRYRFTRKAVTAAELEPAVAQASSHVVRLWAKDEIEGLRTKRSDANVNIAKSIAVRHQLVTPVSGAVVLESQEQYERNDLQPVDPDTVPTIPEPATVVLLGVGGLILTQIRKRTKHDRKQQ